MNDLKRTKKQSMIEAVIESSETEYWVQRPNIAVQMTLSHPVTEMTAYGFAKVSHPDEWDLNFGVELATKKAAAEIVRCAKILGEDLDYLIV